MEASTWIKKAISKDETRLNLCGVWTAGAYRFATNGHRMHLLRLSQDAATKFEPAWREPVPYLDEQGKLYPPNIQAVIPEKGNLIALDKNGTRALKKLLQRAYAAANAGRGNGRYAWIGIDSTGGLLSVHVGDRYTPALGFVAICDATSYRSQQIGFQVGYLQDAIAGASTVRVLFNDKLDPVRIDRDCGRELAVVMPARL